MPIGIYRPGAADGITRVPNRPRPIIVQPLVNHASRPCPACGRPATRLWTQHRSLRDLGDAVAGGPIELDVTYSQHRGKPCHRYFNADMTDLTLSGVEGAAPGGHYANRVVAAAVRHFHSAQGEAVGKSLQKLSSPTLENALVFLGEELLPSTGPVQSPCLVPSLARPMRPSRVAVRNGAARSIGTPSALRIGRRRPISR